jgi:hypothetical protein
VEYNAAVDTMAELGARPLALEPRIVDNNRNGMPMADH